MSLPERVHFGVFDLDTQSGELRKQGSKIRLPHQSFQVLAALLERPGALVTREELRRKLWPGDTFVNFDTGLSSAVKKLREALGDSAESPRFIETLPKHGYRFIAPVTGGGESVVATAPVEAAVALPHAASTTGRRSIVAGIALVSLAAVAVLGLTLGDWRDRAWTRVHPSPIRSVALLPLENLTGDPLQDGLVEALSDSLTTELVRTGLLEVASRTSAAQFKDSPIGVPDIARKLKVDAVVEGTVSRLGDRWLLNVQLIQGATDRHVWAQRYERGQGEIASLPREMAWEMLRAIPPRLQPHNERGEAHRRPANEEAYAAYVMGRHFLGKGGPRNVEKAIEYFRRATAEDPGYAPAYSGLSDAYRLETAFDIRPETLREAEAAARTALELDGNLAEAHTSLGGVLWRYWNWEEAEREYRRALELDPGYAEGYRSYGHFLLMLRRIEDAISALRRAQELDRLSPTISVEFANALTYAGHSDEALHELERARDLDPSFWRTYLGMAFWHARRNDWNGAISALAEAPSPPARLSANPWLGYFYAAAGRRAEALKFLSLVEAETRAEPGSSTSLGIVQLGLGNRSEALDLFERGVRERPADITITTLLYDLLEDEPRYQALLSDMGLHFTDPPRTRRSYPPS